MPQNRKRSIVKGAKSMGIRTKNKIGGRKSGMGAKQISSSEIEKMLGTVRKRDRNKLRRVLENRLPS